MADWKLIPKFRAFSKDLQFSDYIIKRFIEDGNITKHEADQMDKWGKTMEGWKIMNEYDYTDMSVPYNYEFNDNLSEEVFNKKLDNMFDKPIPKEKWWENKKTIKLAKMPKVPEFNIPTKIKPAKPNTNQNYDDKYRPIVDTFIMNLSREEKFEVLKALHNQDTKKLEALIKKYTSKPITLKKIPKVPKVSSKKILKGVPEFDHNIPDYEFNIPTKMTKLKPSVSSKQQSKVIKEIDNMLKDINKIIDDHKPVTIKAEIKTVKKRGRPPKTTTVIDVNTKQQ